LVLRGYGQIEQFPRTFLGLLFRGILLSGHSPSGQQEHEGSGTAPDHSQSSLDDDTREAGNFSSLS
jgi:hypothetical protein